MRDFNHGLVLVSYYLLSIIILLLIPAMPVARILKTSFNNESSEDSPLLDKQMKEKRLSTDTVRNCRCLCSHYIDCHLYFQLHFNDLINSFMCSI